MRFLIVELDKVIRLGLHKAIHRVCKDLAADAFRVKRLNNWVTLREIDDHDSTGPYVTQNFLSEGLTYRIGVQFDEVAQLEVTVYVRRSRSSISRKVTQLFKRFTLNTSAARS